MDYQNRTSLLASRSRVQKETSLTSPLPPSDDDFLRTLLMTHSAKTEPVYEPLNKEQLKRRMSESFPSVYLTIISIVQGVALGILAQNSFGYIGNLPPEQVTIARIATLAPYTILSFLIIVVVSFEYNWFVGIYRWSPKFWDTFIPLLLGLCQIGALYFLTKPKVWWILNAVFVLVGIIAFNNTRKNLRSDMFEDKRVYEMTREGVRGDMLTIVALPFILGSVGLFYEQTPMFYYWRYLELFGFFSFLVVLIALFIKDERFIRAIINFSILTIDEPKGADLYTTKRQRYRCRFVAV